jgi:protein-tyrosine phosphatase
MTKLPAKAHEPFVDIHCHLLPGLDDGAATMAEALEMAEMAVDEGIGTIVATPHQLGSHVKNAGEAIRAAAAGFQQALDRRGIPLRVLPGADVRIEPDLPAKIGSGEVVTLADRRRHVLLELPHDVYVPLDRLLMELSAASVTGILSHPERNGGILRRPAVLRPLVERGCLLQITAGSLTGAFGSRTQGFAEWMVEQGLVHFVSTDAHGTDTRPPLMRRAFQRVAELAGEAVAVKLCCQHPRKVAAGDTVVVAPSPPAKPSWTGWFRRTFSSEPATAQPIL